MLLPCWLASSIVPTRKRGIARNRVQAVGLPLKFTFNIFRQTQLADVLPSCPRLKFNRAAVSILVHLLHIFIFRLFAANFLIMFSVTTIIQPLRLFSLLYDSQNTEPMQLNFVLRKSNVWQGGAVRLHVLENSKRFSWESSVDLFTIFVCLQVWITFEGTICDIKKVYEKRKVVAQ